MSDPQQPPRPPYASNAPQPGANPTQPGAYPAQPGANSPQPYYAAESAPRAPSAVANAPGRLGFILGLVSLGISLLTSLVVDILIRTDGYAVVSIVNGFGAFISFAAAVAALVLGIAGLRKPGAPHGQAGIGTGLGIAGVAGGVFTLLLFATHSFSHYF